MPIESDVRASGRHRGQPRRPTYLACVGLANESDAFGHGDAFCEWGAMRDERAEEAGEGGGRATGVGADGVVVAFRERVQRQKRSSGTFDYYVSNPCCRRISVASIPSSFCQRNGVAGRYMPLTPFRANQILEMVLVYLCDRFRGHKEQLHIALPSLITKKEGIVAGVRIYSHPPQPLGLRAIPPHHHHRSTR